MEIMIKNMEMPNNCNNCKFSHLSENDDYYGRVCVFHEEYLPNKGRSSKCPLVALPEHGDLCDKTFLNTMIENADWSDKEALADYIIDLVYDAEVIVEATE